MEVQHGSKIRPRLLILPVLLLAVLAAVLAVLGLTRPPEWMAWCPPWLSVSVAAVLSKIIHGYRTPSHPERKLLADFLGVDEAWLFEEYEAAPGNRFTSVVTNRKAAEHGQE